MLGILITLLVIAGVAYCVLKNYYPPIILLLAGFSDADLRSPERNHAEWPTLSRRTSLGLIWLKPSQT